MKQSMAFSIVSPEEVLKYIIIFIYCCSQNSCHHVIQIFFSTEILFFQYLIQYDKYLIPTTMYRYLMLCWIPFGG